MESRGIKEEERCGRGGRVEAKSSDLPRGDEHSLSRGISCVSESLAGPLLSAAHTR